MTINQLKELDAEIHKRIPYEGKIEAVQLNDSHLLGTWECLFNPDGSPYEEDTIDTIEFLGEGIGNIEEYNVKANLKMANCGFTYETEDSGRINTNVMFVRILYEYGEDEEGPYLIRIGAEKYKFRKIKD